MFCSSSYFISISTMAHNSSVTLKVSSCQPRGHFFPLLWNSSYFLRSGPNQLCEMLIQGKHSGDRFLTEVVYFTFPLKSKYIQPSYVLMNENRAILCFNLAKDLLLFSHIVAGNTSFLIHLS